MHPYFTSCFNELLPLYNMFRYTSLSILWLIVYFSSAIGDQEGIDIRKAINITIDEFMRNSNDINEFCSEANLIIFPNINADQNTVVVNFQLHDPQFQGCFTDYDISLKKENVTVYYAKVSYVYKKQEHNKASHRFENVPCGIYDILIRPCYVSTMCAPTPIKYNGIVNMSSDDCFDNLPQALTSDFIQSQHIERKIIIFLAVFSVISVFSMCGMVYYYFSGSFEKRIIRRAKQEAAKFVKPPNPQQEAVEVTVKNIHVYIFHYYNKKNEIKSRVEMLRDFLVQSSYYSSVRVTESELYKILENPNDWLNEALQERSKDGSIIKIIIILSEQENEDEEYEIGNSMCTQAIEILDNDKRRSLIGYDTLFVVRFRDMQVDCRRLANIVSGARYTIPDHLIDLCRNLCWGSGLDPSKVERNIEKLLLNHEIRHLGRD